MNVEVGFPLEKPNVKEDPAGWLCGASRRLLDEVLNDQTKVVIELGSWLGLSSRFIARKAPNATVFCVDHWKGSQEHKHVKHSFKLPTLWETYCVNCWDFKGQIIPIKGSTLDGMDYLYALGIAADVIYIDASHEYEDVLKDIKKAVGYWPDAHIVGDDWAWSGVQAAVNMAARELNKTVHVEGKKSWKFVKNAKGW